MRNVARQATLDFYGLVLENKGPLLVGVAGKADGILRGRGADLFRTSSAVRIMAIGALQQTFVNAMVKRHFELCLLLQMAGVAELRLRFDQQEFLGTGVVRGMAGNATDIVQRVNRVDRIHVLRSASVAGHAAGVDFLGGSVLESKNFRNVAATGHVSCARSVAGLATLQIRAFLGVQRGDEVRRGFEVAEEAFCRHVCVASLAGVGTHVV